MKTDNNSGVILVAVVCFTAITAILVLGILSESGSQLKMADRQVRREQAFYVAEGGAERAVSFIANNVGIVSGVGTGSIGKGTFYVTFDSTVGSGGRAYTIVSTGAVNGITKGVIMTGVRQDSWARYALWYDHSGGPIYFRAGETNNGPVHSNTNIYLEDNPVFNGPVTCVPTNWGQWSDTAVFSSNGFQLGVAYQSMASVNFTNLRAAAGMVVTGFTSITLAGTNMIASNAGRHWTNTPVMFPTNGLIYVSGGTTGTVQVGGQLHGALTIAADYDIKITNHITYAVHPTNNSDDALGLVARHDVEVATVAPNNVNIFAHIISCNTDTNFNAGFHVEDYDTRTDSGKLTVYGGIVQNNRGAVGTQGSSWVWSWPSGWTLVPVQTGFLKNYTYDVRFGTVPPPYYPTVNDVYIKTSWREIKHAP